MFIAANMLPNSHKKRPTALNQKIVVSIRKIGKKLHPAGECTAKGVFMFWCGMFLFVQRGCSEAFEPEAKKIKRDIISER